MNIEKTVARIIKEHGKKRGALITVLQKTQETLGYLPRPAITRIASHLGIPVAEIMGVVTFYTQFRLKPVGRQHIRVCHGTACHVSGAERVSYALEEELGIGHGETTQDGNFSVEDVACLGCCSLAPVIMIQDETYGRITSDKMKKVLQECRELDKKHAGSAEHTSSCQGAK